MESLPLQRVQRDLTLCRCGYTFAQSADSSLKRGYLDDPDDPELNENCQAKELSEFLFKTLEDTSHLRIF